MRFTLDPKKFTEQFLRKVATKHDVAMWNLVEVVKSLTPEDTGEMVNSYKVKKSAIEGFIITSGISNTATDKGFPYPVVVDKWVGKTYMYQKPKGNKRWYIGDWVHTFSRAIDAYKDKFISILKG